MMEFIVIVLIGVFVFVGIQIFYQRPELFKSEALSQGIGTLGFLALGLMAVVCIGVMILEAL